MLGTPPAFILSQDQTLKYSVFDVRSETLVVNHSVKIVINLFSYLLLLFRLNFSVRSMDSPCRHHSPVSPNELELNVQGCFVIQLSSFNRCCFISNSYILSHVSIFVNIFFRFFSKAAAGKMNSHARTKIILPLEMTFVNTFFRLIFILDINVPGTS